MPPATLRAGCVMFWRRLGAHLTQRPTLLRDLNMCEKTEPSPFLVPPSHFWLRGWCNFLSVRDIPTEQDRLSLAFIRPHSNKMAVP